MAQFYVDTDQSLLDIEFIYQHISTSYWAKDIPMATLKKSLQHSLCFGLYIQQGKQVGFARLITDYATFAYLADVFVTPDYQGLGGSKLLMSEIAQHPELQGLRRVMLATKDAHGLYRQYGFEPVEDATMLMQKWQPNIYQKNNVAADG